MFEWLENSSLAIWVGESLYAYPLMLSLHAIGLAVMVGISVMISLRLMGLFATIEAAAFRPLMKLAWAGFAVNLISGSALFSSQASVFVDSTPFLTKISLVTLGVVLAALIQRRLDRPVDGTTRLLALLSLLAWLGAVIAGRLIAYL